MTSEHLDRVLGFYKDNPRHYNSRTSKVNRIWEHVKRRMNREKEPIMVSLQLEPDGGKVTAFKSRMRGKTPAEERGKYERKAPPKHAPSRSRAAEIIASRPKPRLKPRQKPTLKPRPRHSEVESRKALSSAIATGRRAHKLHRHAEHRNTIVSSHHGARNARGESRTGLPGVYSGHSRGEGSEIRNDGGVKRHKDSRAPVIGGGRSWASLVKSKPAPGRVNNDVRRSDVHGRQQIQLRTPAVKKDIIDLYDEPQQPGTTVPQRSFSSSDKSLPRSRVTQSAGGKKRARSPADREGERNPAQSKQLRSAMASFLGRGGGGGGGDDPRKPGEHGPKAPEDAGLRKRRKKRKQKPGTKYSSAKPEIIAEAERLREEGGTTPIHYDSERERESERIGRRPVAPPPDRAPLPPAAPGRAPRPPAPAEAGARPPPPTGRYRALQKGYKFSPDVVTP